VNASYVHPVQFVALFSIFRTDRWHRNVHASSRELEARGRPKECRLGTNFAELATLQRFFGEIDGGKTTDFALKIDERRKTEL
jgi:hypothetical protein